MPNFDISLLFPVFQMAALVAIGYLLRQDKPKKGKRRER